MKCKNIVKFTQYQFIYSRFATNEDCRLLTRLADAVLDPLGGGNLSNSKQGPIYTIFKHHPSVV